MIPPNRAASLALLLSASVLACDEPTRPWDGSPDGKVVDESLPFLPTTASAPLFAAAEAGPASSTPASKTLPRSRRGGLWADCHRGFRSSDRPKSDVTRLGLLCGPSCGMQLQRNATLTGRIAHDAPAGVHRFPGRAGACYRIAASASDSVLDLDAQVTTGEGQRIATDETRARWLLLDADRPFCPLEDGELLLAITAKSGQGAYAAQIWSLAARPRIAAPDIDGVAAPK